MKHLPKFEYSSNFIPSPVLEKADSDTSEGPVVEGMNNNDQTKNSISGKVTEGTEINVNARGVGRRQSTSKKINLQRQ